MRIKFHGPLDRVTGSCTELHDPVAGHHLLVDCGMWQGEGVGPEVNLAPFPFKAADIQMVFLTHAHLDHCGRLPLLAKRGFEGTVYCSQETAELAQLSLMDAARHGENGFTEADVKRLKFVELDWSVFNNLKYLGGELHVRVDRTGYILGATSVSLLWGPRHVQKSIVFAGRLGPHAEDADQRMLRYRMAPGPNHYAVVASESGGHLQSSKALTLEARLERLTHLLTEAAVERDGVVIIPATSVGGVQELLLDLHLLRLRKPSMFDRVPVYLDSDLAEAANSATARAIERTVRTSLGKCRLAWLSKGLPAWLGLEANNRYDEVLLVDCLQEMLDPTHRSTQMRSAALANWRRLHQSWPQGASRASLKGPAIVVTSTGQGGGPLKAWLDARLVSPRTTVLIADPRAAEAVASHVSAPLSRSAESGVPVFGDAEHAGARVATLPGYAECADPAGVNHWLHKAMTYFSHSIKHRTVFIQHGNASAREGLSAAIALRAAAEHASISVELPAPDSPWFDLNLGTWVEAHASEQQVVTRR